MVIKPARQADRAEHGSIERYLPGDYGGRQAIVCGEEVEEEAGHGHGVDSVRADGVSQLVQHG